MQINPKRIPGAWDEGFALDLHTVSSEFLGHDEYGHPQFDTRRTPLGDLLYRLKYRGDVSAVAAITDVVSKFVHEWNPGVALLVPVPPTRSRPSQPLYSIAESVGRVLNLPVDMQSLHKAKETPELKNVYDFSERMELLDGAYTVEVDSFSNQRILLLDDLFRSGATLNAITRLLRSRGKAAAIFALALTRTRTSS